LKLAHAQRLLPIEQLLTEAAGVGAGPAGVRNPVKLATTSDLRSAPPSPTRGNTSPFAADSARKGGPKPELATEAASATGPRMVTSASAPAPVIMGSAAPDAIAEQLPSPAPEVSFPKSAQSLDEMRSTVLNALGEAGHRMLVSMLETGEWTTEGNDLIIRVAASATVIDMSVGADAKRLAIATASGALGKPMRLKVLPGGTAQTAPVRPPSASKGGRTRAEEDPIVRRLQEKFGAEIRTIIDQRDKK
jgi:DNA polymerase III subunit gamma/tau